MLVNSFVFWVFFTIILIPYFTIFKGRKRCQNIWILFCSYFFYGWAEWKMLPLLLAMTAIFYWLGIQISYNNKTNPKLASKLTTLGVLLGLGGLFYFKYLGFCIDQFSALFESIGIKTNISTFNIIMPLGISFFTFKLIGYVIDVHREYIKPSRDIVAFGAFIAFFPTIMSGPIDRPSEFLPQLDKGRKADIKNISEGLKRILWGMFMKMCIADRVFGYTEAVFGNYTHHNGITIAFASFLYLFQLYTDFAGYSEMAVGVSQIMGIRIRENFMRPFWAQNVAEYWRRWHMSLTTWITDYVFKPLNIKFMDWGNYGLYLATFLNLVIIGIWHGANWTYALFGVYHGIMLIITTALTKRRKKLEKQFSLKNNIFYIYSRTLLTFFIFMVGSVLFRAESVTDFFLTLAQLSNHTGYLFRGDGIPNQLMALLCILILMFKEYKDERNLNIHFIHSKNAKVEVISIIALISCVLLTADYNGGQFIYFQF